MWKTTQVTGLFCDFGIKESYLTLVKVADTTL